MPALAEHPRVTVPLPTRLGLSRVQSAEYIGISPSLFDKLVTDGQMPSPKCAGRRKIWNVQKLKIAFENLPGEDAEEENEWNEVHA